MNETIERIEKNALEYGLQFDKHYRSYASDDFQAGAISERNNTAQQAIDIVQIAMDDSLDNSEYLALSNIKEKLERLKIDTKG